MRPPATRMPIVTLLTDFGMSDGYVGAMKGVLLRQAPGITLVDLSHTVRAFDVQAAAYLLASCAQEFPVGTIHVAVVDPGVGSARRILIAESQGQRFVVPDNGLLDMVRLRVPIQRWIHVTRWPKTRGRVSSTFHGRDIFAPLAAVLATGTPAHHFGAVVRHVPFQLRLQPPRMIGASLQGVILHIDHFGSLVTSIDAQRLRRFAQGRPIHVRVGRHLVRRFVRTYADATPGTVVALIGSHDWLELAVVEGHAARRLHARRGDAVIITRGSQR